MKLYLRTASQLKEIMNVCTGYYLLLITKKVNTLNNIGVLLKGVLFDLHARNLHVHIACMLVSVRAICQALEKYLDNFF